MASPQFFNRQRRLWVKWCIFGILMAQFWSTSSAFQPSIFASFNVRTALQSTTQSDEDYYSEASSSSSSSPPRRSVRIRPIRQPTRPQAAEVDAEEARKRHDLAWKDPSLFTNTQFSEREDIHPATKRAIVEVLGLDVMTEIQSETYQPALAGNSILATSRTGTGKTLGFLLPSLERLLLDDQRSFCSGKNVGVLILAPTRELALQTTDQAKKLLSFHRDDISVLCLYGGTKMGKDLALLKRQIPSILVCTPGKLCDHLETTRLRGRKFSDMVAESSIFVLDEADFLLRGFPAEMKTIKSHLPRSEKRQTMLFSATLPRKFLPAFEAVLPKDYTLVDCVGSGANNNSGQTNGIAATTNAQVEYSYAKLQDRDSYVPGLVAIVLHFMATKGQNNKMVVFLPTTRLVKFFREFMAVGMEKHAKVFQMHSQMSQSARTKASQAFREAKKAVLFTTDISARGLDYPDVSLVLQYGYPKSVTEYTHRCGRTGRIGKGGRNMVVLLPFEEQIEGRLIRSKTKRDDNLQRLLDELPHQELLNPAKTQIGNGHRVLTSAAESAYLSLLAYYMARAESLGISGQDVMDLGDSFSNGCGLKRTPVVAPALLSKLKKSTGPRRR